MGYIYAPGPYYQRIRTFLREYQPPKISGSLRLAVSHGVRPGQSSASASSAANASITGVCCSGRSSAARALFPLAVTLSIYGHHFRKTCRVLGL